MNPINKDFLQAAPVEPAKEKSSAAWRGFMVVVKFVYEIAAKVGILLILGVLAYFFLPQVAPACFGAAVAVFGSRLVTKILDLYDIPCLDKVKKNVAGPVDKYKLDLIAFVVAVAFSFLHPIAGCVLASAVGVVSGFTLGSKIATYEQQRERDALNDPKSGRQVVVV